MTKVKMYVHQYYGAKGVQPVDTITVRAGAERGELTRYALRKLDRLAIPGATCFLTDAAGHKWDYDFSGQIYRD